MREIIQIGALFKKKLDSWKSMNRSLIQAYLLWHLIRQQIAIVKKNNKIIGVATARGVNSLQMAQQDRYHYNDESELVYCDEHVSNGTIASLLLALKARFPRVKKIAFRRPKGMQTQRVYDFDRFFHLARKAG